MRTSTAEVVCIIISSHHQEEAGEFGAKISRRRARAAMVSVAVTCNESIRRDGKTQLYYIRLIHSQTSTPGTFGITVTGSAVGARGETSGVQSFYLSSSIRMVLIIGAGALYVRYV
jgi:hypothetical protein